MTIIILLQATQHNSMNSSHKKHYHRRSSSLRIDELQNHSEYTVFLVEEFESNETIKLLRQSEMKCDFEVIYDQLNPEAVADGEESKNPIKTSPKNLNAYCSIFRKTQNECFTLLPYHVFQINQLSTNILTPSKEVYSLPFRNRLRYHRNAQLKAYSIVNHNHNSSINNSFLDLNEIGEQIANVSA